MRCLIAVPLLITFTLTASGQEWTRFRGPNGAGVSDATSIPVMWTTKDQLWKTALQGTGHSSPVVLGDKVFVTAGDPKSGKRLIHCVSADKGAVLWTKEFDASAYKMHKRNSIATSTPAVDADRLYLAWGTPDRVTMMALDHQGELKWQTDLGPFKSQHGFGASPVVVDGLVILQNDQDGGGAIIALDAATGKKRWELPRQPKNATYSTPCLYQPAGQRPVLIFTN
jgi:outer membrane protein assembly factor BamB